MRRDSSAPKDGEPSMSAGNRLFDICSYQQSKRQVPEPGVEPELFIQEVIA